MEICLDAFVCDMCLCVVYMMLLTTTKPIATKVCKTFSSDSECYRTVCKVKG